jgi:hypothetical protein
MGNISGNAYALTVLAPIKSGHVDTVAFSDLVRDRLESWNMLPNSPMAQVPQTYLCRYFVLDDVYNESLPGASALDTASDYLPIVPNKIRLAVLPAQDQLKSKYLVFSSNFHGDLDAYLHGMWSAISGEIKEVWGFCYGFDQVGNAEQFAAYMKKCQLTASLFFVGSNDDPLEEQLKALYLKQEFSKFVVENQGLPTAVLQKNYQEFIARVQPKNLAGPAWTPGQYSLSMKQEKQQEAAL